jgi:prepilin-type N-terminal cleavage/methylation domain-containing protein
VGRAGFTLIELLVSSVLASILMVFVMETFTVNNFAYTRIDAVVGSQQSLRVISSLFERDIRHAGFMLREESAVCGLDDDDGPDTLYVTDHNAPETGSLTTMYEGSDVQGVVTNVTTGPTPVTLLLDSVFLESTVAGATYDTDGNGTNDSDFQIGGGAIIVDTENPSRGSACGTVTAVNIGAKTVTINVRTAPLAAAGGSVQLTVLPAIEYQIVGTQLFRNGLLLSNEIEDFQISLFFDVNGDNLVDAGEILGDGVGGDYFAAASDAADLRGVQLSLVARTRLEDPNFRGFFQATQNRNAVAGNDGFRRRVHSNTIRLRNVGSRIEGL